MFSRPGYRPPDCREPDPSLMPPHLRSSRPRGDSVRLFIAAALLILWQTSFIHSGPYLDSHYNVTASVGLCDDVRDFFVFHYYFNEFP